MGHLEDIRSLLRKAAKHTNKTTRSFTGWSGIIGGVTEYTGLRGHIREDRLREQGGGGCLADSRAEDVNRRLEFNRREII